MAEAMLKVVPALSGPACYDAVVAFTRWDPLRDLLALHEQLGQLVGSDAPGWTPAVDLFETADYLERVYQNYGFYRVTYQP